MRLLESIRDDVETLAARIDAPEDLLPTYGESEDFARPHIEARHDGLMAWVVVERSVEIQRQSTYSRNELLYWTFAAVTFSMATDYELANRVGDEDPRRLIFEHQLELLGELDARWRAQKAGELGPFLDEIGPS